MEGLVMNYFEDDDLTEDTCYSGISSINFVNRREHDQLLIENKDVQNGLYTIAPNELAQSLEQGSSVTTKEEKTFQNEETLPQIDGISSIVISKVETVKDTLDSALTFNIPHKEELPSENLDTATNDDTKKFTFKCDFCVFMGTSRFALARHKEKCKATAVETLNVTEPSEKLEDKKYLKPKVITFNCDVCDFFATSRFALARHKNSHQDKEVKVEDKKIIIFNCEFCSFSATSRFALARHQEEHKEHLDVKEEKCIPVETTTQIIPKMRVFKCRWCHFTSKFRFALNRHCLSHRKYDTFTCPRCYNLVLAESKSEHLLRCKKKCEHFSCDNCPYKTVYTKMFMKHQNTCKKELLTLKVPATIQQHQTTVKNESNFKCELCSFTTKFHWSLTNHLKSHNPGQSLVEYPKVPAAVKQHETSVKNESNYECKYCSFSTKFHWAFSAHMKSHNSGKPIFKCKNCNFKSTYSAVTKHYHLNPSCFIKNNVKIERRRSKKVLECDQCSFKTSCTATWHKHLISHGDQTGKRKEIIKCKKCAFKTYWKYNFQNHLCLHKIDMQIIDGCKNNKMVECKEGTFNAEMKAAKETHEKLEMSHKKTKNVNNSTENDQGTQDVKTEYKCKYCSVTCTRIDSLKFHLEKHTKLKRPIYKCEKCDFTGFKLNVAKHMVRKHREKTIKCTYCSYSCHRRKNFERHVERHTQRNEPIFKCKYCEFKSLKHINVIHVRMKHPDKLNNYSTCHLCSFRTKYKCNLARHLIRTHKSENIEACTKCNFRSNNLAVHYRTAHNKKKSSKAKSKNLADAHMKGKTKIRCDLCSYATFKKQHIKRHHYNMHIKNNKPLLQCTLCDYKSYQRLLTRHYKYVHGTVKFNTHAMYYCKFCSFSSKHNTSVLYHTRNQHMLRKSDMYECDYCEFKSTKYSLGVHMTRVHRQAKDSNRH